jgi:hypothetical protein
MIQHKVMQGVKKLIVLAQKFAKENQEDKERTEYGGYKFELPADHKAAMIVKNGGFSCANCKFVNVEKHSCGNQHYQDWNGSDKLPDVPLNQICSDWFEPKNK